MMIQALLEISYQGKGRLKTVLHMKSMFLKCSDDLFQPRFFISSSNKLPLSIWCVNGELIKQRSAFDSMGLAKSVEVRAQGFRIAGNIDNVVEPGNQLQRFIIDAGAGRIDKNRGESVIFQRDTPALAGGGIRGFAYRLR